MSNQRVTIGFFRATGCGACCQKYRHVELRFDDGTTTSITQEPGRVHFDQYKVLSNENYACFMTIIVSKEQEDAMKDVAWEYSTNGTGFSTLGMYWNILCRSCPIRSNDSVFCSQYVTRVLQAGNLLLDMDADCTSPTALYNRLRLGEDGFNYSVNSKKKRVLMV